MWCLVCVMCCVLYGEWMLYVRWKGKPNLCNKISVIFTYLATFIRKPYSTLLRFNSLQLHSFTSAPIWKQYRGKKRYEILNYFNDSKIQYIKFRWRFRRSKIFYYFYSLQIQNFTFFTQFRDSIFYTYYFHHLQISEFLIISTVHRFQTLNYFHRFGDSLFLQFINSKFYIFYPIWRFDILYLSFPRFTNSRLLIISMVHRFQILNYFHSTGDSKFCIISTVYRFKILYLFYHSHDLQIPDI